MKTFRRVCELCEQPFETTANARRKCTECAPTAVASYAYDASLNPNWPAPEPLPPMEQDER